ncbi:MAG TPA: VWA domain-containing protein [Methanocella sp.]|jgi:hypothetical protein
MSVVNGRRVIGAFAVLILIWLIPAVAQASVTSVAIYAPVNITAGSSSPLSVLAQDNGVPVAGTSVTVGVIGPGTVTPVTAVTNGSGYASFTLNAQTVKGILTITAGSGGATGTASVPVVAAPPARLDILSPAGLLPADGYCTYLLIARAQDRYGNGCAGWPVNITVDGTHYVATADQNGSASFTIGPTVNKHTYNVVADANGYSRSVPVRFLDVNLYLFSYPSSVPAGQRVSIKALLLDDLTPAPGILLTFDVYSPDSLATPSSFAGYTDADGTVTFTFNTSTKAGQNTVIIGNQSLGGDLRYASVRGTGGQVSQIVLASDPTIADDSTHCILKMWAKDSGGNPVKSEDLTVTRNYGESYLVTTNTNGYAEIDAGASPYVGTVRFDVTAENNVTSNILASYVAGPPAMTVIRAVPNVVASSEVPQPPEMTDIHSTQLITQVTDRWYHPLPGYDIIVSSPNTTAGTIVGPSSGVTNMNGEFYTQFRLGNFSEGTGTVEVRAQSGTLSSTYPITYTNNSFLSVDTTITPRNVSVNGSINVEISIKGLGWNNLAQPVDIMLITDRSGSMDWYSTYVYPANGNPQTGTMADDGYDHLVATYVNPGYSNLQFMLSSPYTNYVNGSYYDGLYIVGPDNRNGHSGTRYYYGTNSANENYYILTQAKSGTYKIYATFNHRTSGGTPPYSFAVLTRPLRLGSAWLDNDSAAKMAATELANTMTDVDQMGLVSFSTSATLNAGLKVINGTANGANKAALLNAINSLDANGGTDVYTGIQKARTEYAAHGRSNAKHVAILLSDGYSQSPASDIAQAIAAKNEGIVIFTIGMGMADSTTLGAIANITGGQFYRAASSLELAERYQQIFKNVSEVVAKDSVMDIIATRSTVNGTLINDTQYIQNSAQVTFPGEDPIQLEPVITCDATNYSLYWEPGPINRNQVWKVNYQLRAIHGGMITPISDKSFIRYTTSDDKNGTIPFDNTSFFCEDNVTGNIGTASPGLRVKINTPANGTITEQLRLMAGWQVSYNGTDTYTQRVSIAPVGTFDQQDIARGFTGDQNSTGTYSFWWNLERVPTGNYTLQVFVTDGTYDAQDEVSISIPYRSGEIVLQ